MKDIMTVMKYTIKEMIRRKSFIISTIIILSIIVIGASVPNLLDMVNGSDEEISKLLIVDNQNIFDGKLDLLKNDDFNYEILINNLNEEEVKNKVKENEVDEALIIEKVNNNVSIKYVLENALLISNVPDDIVNAINSLYMNIQIQKLGLTEEELQSITPSFDFKIEQTEKEVEGNLFTMMMLSIVLFYAIYFCAFQVSSSITTEKTSKIMETLVTSTSPKTIVLGKTIGIGLVGLMQLILIILTGLISTKLFMDPETLESIIDMKSITFGLGIITLIYFILGYFMYSFVYALTGSTVSKPEDVQAANAPVGILAVIGFYLAYFTMLNPASNLNYFASIFPLSSPFCMPFRIMMNLANPVDVLISILLLFITIVIIAKVSIKIYSSAIFNYGSKTSFKDMIKIYKDKNN